MVPTYNIMRENNAENPIEKGMVNFESLWEVRTGHPGKSLPQTSIFSPWLVGFAVCCTQSFFSF